MGSESYFSFDTFMVSKFYNVLTHEPESSPKDKISSNLKTLTGSKKFLISLVRRASYWVPEQLIYSLKSQVQLFQLFVVKETIELAFYDLLKIQEFILLLCTIAFCIDFIYTHDFPTLDTMKNLQTFNTIVLKEMICGCSLYTRFHLNLAPNPSEFDQCRRFRQITKHLNTLSGFKMLSFKNPQSDSVQT